MKIDDKVYHGAAIIFSILTIFSIFFINIDVGIIFLGFSQLFSGLSQVKLSESIDPKENPKGNKYVGIFSIFVGLVIIITNIIKYAF